MARKPLQEVIQVRFPKVTEQPVAWGGIRKRKQADGFKAIVDSETGKVFSIVSKDYRLIRHEAAIEEIEAAIHQTNGLGPYEARTAFYNDGGRIRRVYRFVGVSYEVKPGDFVNPELRLLNSYDLAWPLVVDLGAYRQICSNGLVIGTIFLQLRKRHVTELNRIGLWESVTTALERFEKATLVWKDWAQRPLTQKTFSRVMGIMDFGINGTKEIEGRIRSEAEGHDTSGFPIVNLWAFFNVVCWYCTNRSLSVNHLVTMEERLKKATRHFTRRQPTLAG